MSDEEYEKIIIQILRNMRKATQSMNLQLIPDLNNKLQATLMEYMHR